LDAAEQEAKNLREELVALKRANEACKKECEQFETVMTENRRLTEEAEIHAKAQVDAAELNRKLEADAARLKSKLDQTCASLNDSRARIKQLEHVTESRSVRDDSNSGDSKRALELAQNEAQGLREELAALTRNHDELIAKLSAAQEKVARMTQHVATQTEELLQLRADTDIVRNHVNSSTALSAEGELQLNTELLRQSAELDAMRQELQRAQEAVDKAEIEACAWRQESEVLKRNHAALEAQHAALGAQHADLKDNLRESSAIRMKVDESTSKQHVALVDACEQVDTLSEILKEAQSEAQRLQRDLSDAQAGVESLRAALQAVEVVLKDAQAQTKTLQAALEKALAENTELRTALEAAADQKPPGDTASIPQANLTCVDLGADSSFQHTGTLHDRQSKKKPTLGGGWHPGLNKVRVSLKGEQDAASIRARCQADGELEMTKSARSKTTHARMSMLEDAEGELRRARQRVMPRCRTVPANEMEEALTAALPDTDTSTSSRRRSSPSPDAKDLRRDSIASGFRPSDIVSLPGKERPSLILAEVGSTLSRKRSSAEPTLPALTSHAAAEEKASTYVQREEVLQTSHSAPRLHGSRPSSASAAALEVPFPGVRQHGRGSTKLSQPPLSRGTLAAFKGSFVQRPWAMRDAGSGALIAEG